MKKNLENRKAIQGKGTSELLEVTDEIAPLLERHQEKYPEWEHYTVKNMKNDVTEFRLYKITPQYMKFWNDELYGEGKTKEFEL